MASAASARAAPPEGSGRGLVGYLRSEIIWHKPNPMPESVKDRPTKAHEQIFLLSKSPKYYYNSLLSKTAFGGRPFGQGKQPGGLTLVA